MAVSSSIQFYGKDAVLQAFEHRGVDFWTLWQGRNMMTKGEGGQALSEYLDMIAAGGTNAIYTVRVYEDIDDIKKLKSNTPDDGSFNFRLNDPAQIMTPSQMGSFNQTNQMLKELTERLDRMEAARLEETEEEDEEEDEAITIGGLLRDPERLQKLVEIGRQILGAVSGSPMRQIPAIGAVSRAGQQPPANEVGQVPQSEEERLQRLGNALDTLEKNDPQIIEHLEKLASIAANDPSHFKSLVSILDVWK